MINYSQEWLALVVRIEFTPSDAGVRQDGPPVAASAHTMGERALIDTTELELLRALVDGLPPSGYWDAELRNRLANRALCESLHCTPEAIRGHHVADVVTPELLRISLPKFELALAGQRQQFNRVWVSEDGTSRHLQVTLIPDVVDGRVRGVITHADDVTARRAAESQLLAAQSRMRLALMASPVGIATVGVDGRLGQANPAMGRIFGSSTESLDGRSLDEVTSLGCTEPSRAMIASVLAGDLGFATVECEIARADGSHAAVIVNLTRASEEDPESLGILQMQDITNRKHAEESVRRSQRLLEQAETIAQMGTWEWDLRTDRVHWSKGLHEILQLRPDETDGRGDRGVIERVHPEDRGLLRAAIDRTVADLTSVSIEYRAIRADGRVRVLHLQSDPIVDAAGDPVRVVAVLHDVTDTKRTQQVLTDTSSHLARYAQELQRLAFAADAPAEPAAVRSALTAKQLETLAFVAQGLTNGEIAKRMFVTEATVKWHVRQILTKTSSANRTEAVARVLGSSPQRSDRGGS